MNRQYDIACEPCVSKELVCLTYLSSGQFSNTLVGSKMNTPCVQQGWQLQEVMCIGPVIHRTVQVGRRNHPAYELALHLGARPIAVALCGFLINHLHTHTLVPLHDMWLKLLLKASAQSTAKGSAATCKGQDALQDCKIC